MTDLRENLLTGPEEISKFKNSKFENSKFKNSKTFEFFTALPLN